MLKRLLAIALVSILSIFGLSVPAQATSYDFAVSASATANSTTLPSIITWHINVASIGDNMGSGGAQEGDVEFTAPNTISLVLSDDCDTTGNQVTCHWLVEDGLDANFEVSGLVTLLALGTISVTPTFTSNSPRTDSVSTNNSVTVSCTAVTSLLVTCP